MVSIIRFSSVGLFCSTKSRPASLKQIGATVSNPKSPMHAAANPTTFFNRSPQSIQYTQNDACSPLELYAALFVCVSGGSRERDCGRRNSVDISQSARVDRSGSGEC